MKDDRLSHAPEDRRATIKKLAVGCTVASIGGGLPKQWIKPVVDSVSLPAHAETSRTLPAMCEIPAGCYMSGGAAIGQSFSWPGGGGVQIGIRYLDSNDCTGGGRSFNYELAVAESLAEAGVLLDSTFATEVPTVENTGVCRFYTIVD